MKQRVVRARIDDELKAQSAAVLAACGLEVSDAIRLFLRQVVLRGGLPFAVREQGGVRVVAPARLQAMKRSAQARDRALAEQGKLSAGQTFLIRPEQVRQVKLKWPVVALSD
jgi:DNA-damage-inducible protein J